MITVQKIRKNILNNYTYNDNVELVIADGVSVSLVSPWPCIPSLGDWNKMKLTRPALSRMALRLIQRTRTSISVAILDEVFAERIISTTIWPPRSSDLSPPDFFCGVRWKTQCIRTIPTQLMIWRWLLQNTFGIWTVLYWTRSSRTQFGVSVNIWRLAGDTLNIACNFMYCNYQVHRDFLITLYKCIRQVRNVR
jgi:hypothetical protein